MEGKPPLALWFSHAAIVAYVILNFNKEKTCVNPKKGSGGNTGNIAAAMQSISYQIQHTVCTSDYITCRRETKGNIEN